MLLNLAQAELEKNKTIKSTRREISPVFRRKPYKTTTTKPEILTNSSSDDFYVGKEHYYDNKIDILQGKFSSTIFM